MQLSTLDRVRSVYQSVFKVEPARVQESSLPEDIPGWDSLGHAALVSALEKAFAVQLSFEEIMELDSVAAVVRVVDRRAVAPGSG